MSYRDLDSKGLESLAKGWKTEGVENLKALGSGAYGTVYEDPSNPSRVIKFQYGDRSTFDTEVEGLAESMFNENVDVPRIHESNFSPDLDPDSEPHKGSSYIVMDKVEHDGSNHPNTNHKKASWRKSQALSRLYNSGISHNDMHGGNVKYDSATDTPAIIDFGLSTRDSRDSNWGIKKNIIERGLQDSGDSDAAIMFRDLVNEASERNDKGQILDLLDQGQEVLEKSEFRPDLPSAFPKDNEINSSVEEFTNPPKNNLEMPRSKRFATDVWKAPSAFKSGLSVGLADLIPSAETIRTASQNGLGEGAKQFAQEAVMGIPTGAAVGAATAAVPALAPFVPGVGGGMMLTEGARTLNEVSRATTGESLLSKARQTLGTAPRTGNSSPNNSVIEKNQRRMDRVKNPPQIKPATSVPTPIKDLPLPELGRRVRMASERFNPAKLEFGITELLFGR